MLSRVSKTKISEFLKKHSKLRPFFIIGLYIFIFITVFSILRFKAHDDIKVEKDPLIKEVIEIKGK